MPISADTVLRVGDWIRHDRSPIRAVVSSLTYRQSSQAGGTQSYLIRIRILEGSGALRPSMAPARSGRMNVSRVTPASLRNSPVIQVQVHQEYDFPGNLLRNEWSLESAASPEVPQPATRPLAPKLPGEPISRFDRDEDLF